MLKMVVSPLNNIYERMRNYGKNQKVVVGIFGIADDVLIEQAR